jgi:hypothetical protein
VENSTGVGAAYRLPGIEQLPTYGTGQPGKFTGGFAQDLLGHGIAIFRRVIDQ